MDFLSLIPVPDTIPAPAGLFLVLDILTFTLHILVINIIVGSSILMLFTRMKGGDDVLLKRSYSPALNKIPTLFAIGINLGVAPLLFLQVIYGHLFYTSSVLMAVYWIMVIPFLILAYYSAYILSRKYAISELLSKASLWIMAVLLLYIGFMLVTNNMLMIQPEKWTAYFDNRGGTILNLSDPTLIPRYLHFIGASVAVAGLFMASLWHLRGKKSVEGVGEKVKFLKVFAWSTIVQMLIGSWFLMVLPRPIMMKFMGNHLPATILIVIGFLGAIGATITALRGKLRPTISMTLIAILVMVINRQILRGFYLKDIFHLDSLRLAPQYGVMALFLLILVIGLSAVGYMLKISMKKNERSTAR